MYTLMVFENKGRFTIRQIIEALQIYTASCRENGLNLIQGDALRVIEGAFPEMIDGKPIVLRRREVIKFHQLLVAEPEFHWMLPEEMDSKPVYFLFWYNTYKNKFFRYLILNTKDGSRVLWKKLRTIYNSRPDEGHA